MKLLYHITGYKQPEQFRWLYEAIYNQRDLFIIHVDEKSPAEVHSGFRSIANCHANTHFIPSIPIAWGGTGLIRAELAAIRYALSIDPEWRYLVNLSAQDYPLTSDAELRAKLASAWPSSFVECKPLSKVHWRIRKRCWFRYIEFRNKRYFTPIPRLPSRRYNLNWYGAWWHILSRDFCDWWSTSPKAEGYYDVLQTAGMPDEFLIQNLIQDSPFCDAVIPECKHEIIWNNPGEPLSASAHPNVLTMREHQVLRRSGAFFARKFDKDVDQTILRVLAKRVGVSMPTQKCAIVE